MEHTISLGTVEAKDGGAEFGYWIHKGADGWNVFVGREDRSWWIDGPHKSIAAAWNKATELFGQVKERVTA